MVTSDNELKLLEINTNPAMSLDNTTLRGILPDVIDKTISIVLGAQGPSLPKSSCIDPTESDAQSEILSNTGKLMRIPNMNILRFTL